MPRRAYGSGSIQQVREGYWRITVSAGRDPVTGKRRRVVRYVRGNRREADKVLQDLIATVHRGDVPVVPARYTVADLLDDWYREGVHEWSPRTAYGIQYHVRWLKRVLGAVPLNQLSPAMVQRAVAQLRDMGLAPRTIHRTMGSLRTAIRRAMRLGMLTSDPMAGVRIPNPPPQPRGVLTDDELTRLLQAIRRTKYALPILLTARTGMRRGEVLGLRWQDIDWEAGVARVEQVVTRQRTDDGWRVVIKPSPKTAAGRRMVALDPETLSLLRRHRKEQATQRLQAGPTWQDHDLVFCRENGEPIDPEAFTQAMLRVRRWTGIDGLNLHGLRHAHASHLLAAGWPVTVVAERLGHSSPAITAQVYSHAIPDLQQRLLRELGTNMALFRPVGELVPSPKPASRKGSSA